MRFRDWQELTPEAAAREVMRRIAALPTAQQRAAIVRIRDEETLRVRFEQAAALLSGSPLARVPFALKDLFKVAGEPMFAGSAFLPEVRPTPADDGALVATLRNLGGVLAARTHLYEFAYGLTGENRRYGDVVHPHFPGRTAGGSSSGSAALVAADVVPLAIGTDTGGSVRVPAAYCGLYGFRLTPREPFIADAFPLAPSFDTAGWFTSNADDMLATCEALVGTADGGDPRGIFIGGLDVDESVGIACREAARHLAVAADVGFLSEWKGIMAGSAEAFSVLQSSEALEVHREWFDARRGDYLPEVWDRIDRGRHWTREQRSAAEATRDRVLRFWLRMFRSYDFVVLPATPTPALDLRVSSPADRARLLALTAPASLAGLPVLTIPIRLANGLTCGLQVVVSEPRSPAVAWALRQMAPAG